MSDNDLLKQFFKQYEAELASCDNADYQINRPQFDRLVSAYRVFETLTAENGGSIEPFRFVPKEINGGVTAYFRVFYITGEDLKRVAEVFNYISALSIDSLTDGTVCVSFTVPRVFEKKEK